MKITKGWIDFLQLHRNSLKISLYTGTRFNNLLNGNSQVGFTVFLNDHDAFSAAISWISKNTKKGS